MSDSGQGQKVPLQIAGKSPVIIMTIFFSCLSFTLGYFVGKKVSVNGTDGVFPTSEIVSGQLNPQPRQAQTVDPAEAPKTNLGAPDQSLEIKPPGQGNASGIAVEVKTADLKEETAVKPVKPTTPANIRGKNVGPLLKRNNEEVIYTVQLGAFKSKADAVRFRAKYSKKGYKIYIVTVKEINNMYVYKVKTGEFLERKSADILAQRLKKTERLNAFVAPANE
jgi:cell division septation protein DedD